MKLSVNEAALPGLRAAIQQVLIAKFVFGLRQIVTGLFEKRAPGRRSGGC